MPSKNYLEYILNPFDLLRSKSAACEPYGNSRKENKRRFKNNGL